MWSHWCVSYMQVIASYQCGCVLTNSKYMYAVSKMLQSVFENSGSLMPPSPSPPPPPSLLPFPPSPPPPSPHSFPSLPPGDYHRLEPKRADALAGEAAKEMKEELELPLDSAHLGVFMGRGGRHVKPLCQEHGVEVHFAAAAESGSGPRRFAALFRSLEFQT